MRLNVISHLEELLSQRFNNSMALMAEVTGTRPLSGNLPDEIIFQICTIVHKGCLETKRSVGYRPVSQLSALSLLSRKWHQIAMSLLYSTVILEERESVELFVRTMVSSPTLRGLVKELRFKFESQELEFDDFENNPVDLGWDFTKCLSYALEEVGAEFSDKESWGPQQAVEFSMEHDQVFKGKPLCDCTKDANGNPAATHLTGALEDETGILLFILPELETLEFSFEVMGGPDYDGLFLCELLLQTLTLTHRELIKKQKNPSYEMQIPGSITNLKTLVVRNPFAEPGTIKSTWPPIKFWNVAQSIPLLYAPKLTSLTLERVGDDPFDLDENMVPGLVSPIRDLSIHNTIIGARILSQYLKFFSNLISFSCSMSDLYSLTSPEEGGYWLQDNNISPRLYVEALQAHKSSLESITFTGLQHRHIDKMIDHCEYAIIQQAEDEDEEDEDEDDERPEDEDWIKLRRLLSERFGTIDLRPFTNLKHAKFHITDFTGYDFPGDPRSIRTRTHAEPIRVASLLPPSIAHLELRLDQLEPTDESDPSKPLIDLKNLLDDLDQLPNLSQLTINLPPHWQHSLIEHVEELVHRAAAGNVQMVVNWVDTADD